MPERQATEYGESGVCAFTVQPGAEAGAWQDIRNACPTLTDWGIEVLRSGLDRLAKTVIVEPHYVCKDYRDLYSYFYSKKFLPRPSWCARLHFFALPGITPDDLVLRAQEMKLESAYLGYSVIQPVRDNCLGRTMLDPDKLGRDFYCLRTPSRAHLNGVELKVSGYPWMSQSNEPTVCAHAALWGICRYLSERYRAYAEMHPYDLIEMTGSASGRRVPYRGMTYEDYCEILSAFGCHPVVVIPRDTQQKDWTKSQTAFYDLYSYVESGFPVLVSFRGHAATVVGHTLSPTFVNAPEHYAEAGFQNSFGLVKQFVVVDGNFFPYQLLGFAADEENYGKELSGALDPAPSIDSIFAAVVPLPEKAFMTPDRARKLAYAYLHQPDVREALTGVRRRLHIPDGEPMIARTFLTSCISFKSRKRLLLVGRLGRGVDRLASLPVGLNLPHFIWIMEVSPLTCYNQGRCVGEIVLDASSSEDECDYIYMRVGNAVFHGGNKAVYEDGLMTYPQYTHNLGERPT